METAEPADTLSEQTRMPRSLCAFVLRLAGGDLLASAGVLARVTTEIPGWSRMPQGVLWKQVQGLVGHAARPRSAVHPSVDVDLDFAADDDPDDAFELEIPVAPESPAPGDPSAAPDLERLPFDGDATDLSLPLHAADPSIEPSLEALFPPLPSSSDDLFTQFQLPAAPPAISSAPPAVAAVHDELSGEAFELPPEFSAPPEERGAPEAASDLTLAVLGSDDWRAVLAGVAFDMEALEAVRERAARDAERELADGAPRRVFAGEPDPVQERVDCAECLKAWAFPVGATPGGCPDCGAGWVCHAALGGEVDEAALTYQSAHQDATLAGLRTLNPHFAWHLLAEAQGSVQARLARESGLPASVAGLALDVSAGDEAAAQELLGWLVGRIGAEAAGGAEGLRAAQAALAEIGAEPDPAEVQGRHQAEALLAAGELARHVPGAPHWLCPGCLERWADSDEPLYSCPQCGGPLVHERPLGDPDADADVLEAINARVARHLRETLAPGFDWDQVVG